MKFRLIKKLEDLLIEVLILKKGGYRSPPGPLELQPGLLNPKAVWYWFPLFDGERQALLDFQKKNSISLGPGGRYALLVGDSPVYVVDSSGSVKRLDPSPEGLVLLVYKVGSWGELRGTNLIGLISSNRGIPYRFSIWDKKIEDFGPPVELYFDAELIEADIENESFVKFVEKYGNKLSPIISKILGFKVDPDDLLKTLPPEEVHREKLIRGSPRISPDIEYTLEKNIRDLREFREKLESFLRELKKETQRIGDILEEEKKTGEGSKESHGGIKVKIVSKAFPDAEEIQKRIIDGVLLIEEVLKKLDESKIIPDLSKLVKGASVEEIKDKIESFKKNFAELINHTEKIEKNFEDIEDFLGKSLKEVPEGFEVKIFRRDIRVKGALLISKIIDLLEDPVIFREFLKNLIQKWNKSEYEKISQFLSEVEEYSSKIVRKEEIYKKIIKNKKGSQELLDLYAKLSEEEDEIWKKLLDSYRKISPAKKIIQMAEEISKEPKKMSIFFDALKDTLKLEDLDESILGYEGFVEFIKSLSKVIKENPDRCVGFLSKSPFLRSFIPYLKIAIEEWEKGKDLKDILVKIWTLKSKPEVIGSFPRDILSKIYLELPDLLHKSFEGPIRGPATGSHIASPARGYSRADIERKKEMAKKWSLFDTLMVKGYFSRLWLKNAVGLLKKMNLRDFLSGIWKDLSYLAEKIEGKRRKIEERDELAEKVYDGRWVLSLFGDQPIPDKVYFVDSKEKNSTVLFLEGKISFSPLTPVDLRKKIGFEAFPVFRRVIRKKEQIDPIVKILQGWKSDYSQKILDLMASGYSLKEIQIDPDEEKIFFVLGKDKELEKIEVPEEKIPEEIIKSIYKLSESRKYEDIPKLILEEKVEIPETYEVEIDNKKYRIQVVEEEVGEKEKKKRKIKAYMTVGNWESFIKGVKRLLFLLAGWETRKLGPETGEYTLEWVKRQYKKVSDFLDKIRGIKVKDPVEIFDKEEDWEDLINEIIDIQKEIEKIKKEVRPSLIKKEKLSPKEEKEQIKRWREKFSKFLIHPGQEPVDPGEILRKMEKFISKELSEARVELHSLLFPKDQWTKEEVRDYLERTGRKPLKIEEPKTGDYIWAKLTRKRKRSRFRISGAWFTGRTKNKMIKPLFQIIESLEYPPITHAEGEMLAIQRAMQILGMVEYCRLNLDRYLSPSAGHLAIESALKILADYLRLLRGTKDEGRLRDLYKT